MLGFPRRDLYALRDRLVLESLPDLDSHRTSGDSDFNFSCTVEKSAEITDRRFAFTVSFACLWPLTSEAVGSERVGRGLIEVTIWSDDVEPAGCWLACCAVMDNQPKPSRCLARRCLSPPLAW